jgi:Fe2+ transport system protein FeoA
VIATLQDVKIGRRAVVARITATGPLKRRMFEMGVLPGVSVRLERIGPMGDPIVVGIRGHRLSLRRAEAEQVEVELSR